MGKKLHGQEYIDYTKQRILNTCKTNENGCWIWKGYLCEPKKIYGLTSLALNFPKKKVLAHRASYILWKGPIPDGMQVLHNCDVPLCCNPEHLHLGTPQDNMNEMKERGRKRPAKGEKNRHARLNDKIVLEIRRLYENGIPQKVLRKWFGIASSTISYIITKTTWRHI